MTPGVVIENFVVSDVLEVPDNPSGAVLAGYIAAAVPQPAAVQDGASPPMPAIPI